MYTPICGLCGASALRLRTFEGKIRCVDEARCEARQRRWVCQYCRGGQHNRETCSGTEAPGFCCCPTCWPSRAAKKYGRPVVLGGTR